MNKNIILSLAFCTVAAFARRNTDYGGVVMEYDQNNKIIRVDVNINPGTNLSRFGGKGITRKPINIYIDKDNIFKNKKDRIIFPLYQEKDLLKYNDSIRTDTTNKTISLVYPSLCSREFVVDNQKIPLIKKENNSIDENVIEHYNKIIQKEIENGNYKIAEIMCNGMIYYCDDDPPQTTYFRGIARQRMSCSNEDKSYLENALDDFNHVISLFPDHAGAHNRKGHILLEHYKNIPKAWNEFLISLSICPNNEQYWKDFGHADVFAEIDKARNPSNIKKYSKIFTKDVQKQQQLTINEMYKMYASGRIKAYEDLISANPNNSEFYNNCAIDLVNIRENQKAVEYLNKAIGIEKKDVYFKNRGFIKMSSMDYAGAIKDFKVLLELNQDQRQQQKNKLWEFIACCYAFNKQYDDALNIYKNILCNYSEESISKIDVYNDMLNKYTKEKNRINDKNFFLSKKNSENVEKSFNDITKSLMDVSMVCNNRANLYILNGDLEKAKINYNHAIKLNDDNFFFLNNRAQLKLLMDDKIGAADDIKKGFEINPKGMLDLQSMMFEGPQKEMINSYKSLEKLNKTQIEQIVNESVSEMHDPYLAWNQITAFNTGVDLFKDYTKIASIGATFTTTPITLYGIANFSADKLTKITKPHTEAHSAVVFTKFIATAYKIYSNKEPLKRIANKSIGYVMDKIFESLKIDPTKSIVTGITKPINYGDNFMSVKGVLKSTKTFHPGKNADNYIIETKTQTYTTRRQKHPFNLNNKQVNFQENFKLQNEIMQKNWEKILRNTINKISSLDQH